MDKEEITTVLRCLSCQRETEHRLIYQGDIVKSIVCQECGLEISFDKDRLLALYGEDLVKRVLTKPYRITEEYREDLVKFFSSIPFRIITKPYRMLKEIDSLRDE